MERKETRGIKREGGRARSGEGRREKGGGREVGREEERRGAGEKWGGKKREKVCEIRLFLNPDLLQR